MAGGTQCDKKRSEEIHFQAGLYMRKHFKLLTVKSLCYWSEKVSEGCRKGVWQRKEDRCVFREGGGGYEPGEEAKSSPSHPLSNLPPCGIFLHEWLCHTWGTKWSLSLSSCVCLSPSSCLPFLSYVCAVTTASQAWLVVWCGLRERTKGGTERLHKMLSVLMIS